MKHRLLSVIILVVVSAALVGGAAIAAPYVREAALTPEQPEPSYTNGPLSLKVMTYNVRTVDVSAPRSSPDNWLNRREALIAHILEQSPDILGTQEVLTYSWDLYLEENLTGYSSVGISRDGEAAFFSEKNLIFYKTEKFELLDSGTFWLSETPDKVSRGWDGACNRICTYAILKDKTTGKVFAHYNTHFDHKGPEARVKGSAMVAERVSKCAYPAILTGDFNFDEKNSNYAEINKSLDDTKYLAENTMSYGTYHAYKGNDLTGKSPIDFIMVTPGKFEVKSYEVLFGKHSGVYTSDHFAVIAQLSL